MMSLQQTKLQNGNVSNEQDKLAALRAKIAAQMANLPTVK